MNEKLERIAKLRELLLRMEGDLGLEGLTRFERDLLYAVRTLGADGQAVTSNALRRHSLVEKMSQPTYHRALRELVVRGYVVGAEGRRGTYAVNLPQAKSAG